MAKKKFKSESKRMLELMIHSIYTHKEIFLRELISNASDALDKLYYLSLQDENIAFEKDSFYIRLIPDAQARTLTIRDAGIGMTKEELEENLGTIAQSGSLAFKTEHEEAEEVDIIGQFGVGFYSAFMVADHVTVKSRKFGSQEAFLWESSGADGYEVSPCEKETVGTEIVLQIKADTEEESYGEFLDPYRLRQLVKKYSDYIKYPIRMMTEKPGEKPEDPMVQEDETLNSMVPIWRKNKSELTKDDYHAFYKEKFFDFEDPIQVIHTSADGAVSYQALLYIPSRPPFDYYTKEFQKGLQLYANGVMIMDKCSDLLPDYFGFVRGLVDSADLSLNISRELLQHDRQLKTIAAHIKKKIKNELLALMRNDREKYEAFFRQFARPLKFGMYDHFGAEKDFLVDLVLFPSSKEKKLVSLQEYVERMPEDQKEIYYACGESVDKIDKLPQTETVKEKGYEILYFTEDVDEFAIKLLQKYQDKEFRSVSDSNFASDNTEAEKKAEEHKDLFAFLQEALEGQVVEVKPSARLKTHPVCLSSTGEVSLEMEKVLRGMPEENQIKAQRVLELNTQHRVFATLQQLWDADREKLKKYANVLYQCALLMEGLPLDDPTDFADMTCELLSE